MRRLLPLCTLSFTLVGLGCASDRRSDQVDPAQGLQDSTDAGVDAVMTDSAHDGPVDAEPEPRPVFTVGTRLRGSLAIDEVGIRENYRRGATQQASYVSIPLYPE